MSTEPALRAIVRTTCPYCGVGCGILATPDGGTGAAIAGDPDHSANFGRLCSKGAALGETLSLDGRLLRPEIGGEPVDWDTAIAAVAEGLGATIAAHGPDSVALFVSGQLLTEDYYVANKFAKGFLGTGNIDSNSRLCMSSAVAGTVRAFGEDVVPCGYEDLEAADLIVLVGSNTAWCHPVVFQRIVAAKAKRPRLRLVVIDPRWTATCEGADLHLPIAPGTDVALFQGLLAFMAATGNLDFSALERRVDGFPETLAAALATAGGMAETARLCGLDVGLVARFFDLFAMHGRTVTLWSQGVNQSSAGTDKVSAIINVHLATGRIGRRGAGPFSITGQPNAMGGREVGALANLLAGHLDWSRPGDAAAVADYWQAPNMAAGPGLKAVDLFRAVAAGTIKAIWIIATNPAVSMPDAQAVRAALRACPLVIVSDSVRESDTADLAQIRLPGAGWGEKDGTVTNSERVISRQRPFLAPAGAARPDWWAIAAVARRMGFGQAFDWSGPAAIFREHAALTGLRNGGARQFDISSLSGLSDAAYAGLAPTQWPLDRPPFADGRFSTPNGRARMIALRFRSPANLVSVEYPLVLITGRVRDQWHTMTRTGKTARLLGHVPEPFVAIHPADAAAARIAEGTLARLTSAWGGMVARARIDPGMRRGDVFVPMHWTDRFCPAGKSNGTVNPAADPISGQPELKHTPVRLDPFAAGWYGFLLAEERLGVDFGDWCATLPASADCVRHEIAGSGPIEPVFAQLCARLGQAGWTTLRDPAAGLLRAARINAGRLTAVLFLGPDPALPPRDWLIGLFAQPAIDAPTRQALLAGRLADGPAPEPSVCVCLGVGRSAILAAIGSGADTVALVGTATKAGTNCGSCRPEIAGLLAAFARAGPDPLGRALLPAAARVTEPA